MAFLIWGIAFIPFCAGKISESKLAALPVEIKISDLFKILGLTARIAISAEYHYKRPKESHPSYHREIIGNAEALIPIRINGGIILVHLE